MMPGCVAVAQRTLDPLAQVRILARQPTNVIAKTSDPELSDSGFIHPECSDGFGSFAMAQDGDIGNLDAED
jgi:hypothetical protein